MAPSNAGCQQVSKPPQLQHTVALHGQLRRDVRHWLLATGFLPRCWLVMMGPVVLVVGGAAFLLLIHPQRPGALLPVLILKPVPLIDDFEARVLWFLSALGLLTTMVALAVRSLITIRKYRPRRTCRFALDCAASSFLIALVFSVADSQRGLVYGWRLLDGIKANVPTEYIFHSLNALGAIPSALLVVAIASTAAQTRLKGPIAACRLERRIADVRALLYLGCLTLTIAVLQMYAAYNWASLALPTHDRAATLRYGLLQSTALGGVYSIFVAITFLPCFGIHRALADRLAGQQARIGTDIERRRAWQRKQGILISPADSAKRFIAILGPILAGGSIPAIIELIRVLNP